MVGGGTPAMGVPDTNGDRVVAQCFAAGVDVAAAMVKGGFACDWAQFSGGYYSSPLEPNETGRRCLAVNPVGTQISGTCHGF